MRQLTRLAALTFALFCCLQTALAYDFSYTSANGPTLYYKITGSNTVELTFPTEPNIIGEPSDPDNPWGGYTKPTGNLSVPYNVVHNGITYVVNAIGDYALTNCTGLISVYVTDGVRSIGYRAFRNCMGLASVTIGNNVATIGNSAFYGCTGLTSVSMGNSVTTIGSTAFYGCTNLSLITIGNSVQTIGEYAFFNCSSITSLSFPNSLTSIGDNAFRGCSSLNSLPLNGNLSSIGHNAFMSCTSLTEVYIPVSVNSIGYAAFMDCSNLTTVTIYSNAVASATYTSSDNFKTRFGEHVTSYTLGPQVTAIGKYAFYDCASMTEVTFLGAVSSMGFNAFHLCTGLTKVNINTSNLASWCEADFGNEYANPLVYAGHLYNNNNSTEITNLTIPAGVTIIGKYAFKGCTGLTSVSIPSSVTTIGNAAFSNCTGMTMVTIPNSVATMGNYAFDYCIHLTRVNISSLASWCGIDFGNQYSNPLYYAKHLFLNNSLVSTLTIPDAVTSIKEYAFIDGEDITSLSGGANLTSIASSAFSGCTSLASVTINSNAMASATYTNSNNLNTIFENRVISYTFGQSVTSIGEYALYGGNHITTLKFLGPVSSVGSNAFIGCFGLETLVIANLTAWCGIDFPVSSNNPITITNHVYNTSNTEIHSLTIPSGVTYIGQNAFYGWNGLTSLTIGDNVTTIRNGAFWYCAGITTVTIPNSVTSIGNNAFNGCVGLQQVKTNSLVAWCGIDFGNQYSNPLYYAHDLYLGNTKITSMTIPSSVATIKDYAFYACTGLNALILHSGVTSIGMATFSGCTGLSEMHVGASIPPTVASNSTFTGISTTIPIYVPLGRISTYQAAQYWSRFTNYKGVASPDDLMVTVPYEQEFYQSIIPSKWTSYEGQLVWNGSINKYTANMSTNIDHWYFGFVNGVFLSSHAWANIGNTNHAFWLVSPIMHLDGEYNMLSFDMALTQASGFLTPVTPNAQNNTRIFALVSTDHGLTWTKLEAWKHGLGGYTEIESLTPHATTFEYNLASYADQDIMVGFYMECTNANDAANRVHIDNFKVEGYDLTIPPTITSVETDGHSATVRWEPANPWQQDWDVYYDVNGSNLPDPYNLPSFFTMEWLNNSGRYFFVSGNTHEQVINGLEAASYYRVWVRHRDPFFGTESSWTPATYFQTTSLCAPPKNPQVVTTQTTATITWEPGQPNQTSWSIYVYGYDDMYGHDLTSPSFTMTELTPGSEFQAQISGSCTGGDGGSESIWVEFSTDDYDHLTVNEGDETNENVVIMGDYCCMSNPMSQTQFVIPADMLTDMQYSTIKKLSFYSESDSERWGDASFQIFMTEVNTSDFVNKCEANTVDFVNWNYMTQFYNGTLSIEHHVMTITPSFGGGFYYSNGNLVVGIRQNQTGNCHQGLEWYGVNTNTTQALYNTQLAGVQCEEFLPQVTFAYEPDPYKPPTEFIAYAQGSNEVFFWWEQVDGAISYDIEVSWSPDFDEAEDQLLSDLPDYFFVWDDYEYLEPNSSYYARIRSHFVVNGTDHFSSWSEGVEFTTLSPCPAPTNLTVEVIDNLTVELDWTENGDATEWGIAYAAAGENELGFATYHHPYVLGAPYLEPGKTYTVRVRPICEGEVFAWSNTVTFNTNNIVFEDQNVKALCVASSTGWDTNGDGELSYTEAAAVTTLGEVFKNNDDITTFNELQYFTGLTSIVDHAFGGCGNLTSVVIPVGVTSIGTSAFSYCPNLTTVIVPEGLTTIGSYAFMYDTHLTDFVFPESLRIIGAQTFDHCSSLTYLFIPASVISIPSHAFLGCSGLEYVSVAPGNTIYDSRDDCNAIIATSSNQLRIGCKSTIIPNTVTSIGPNAFRENKALTFIDLPESITTINGAAFYGCSSLMDITLPASLDSIGERGFCNCTGLQSITVEATNPPKIVTGDQDSFYGVDKTIPVYVPCASFGDYQNCNGSPWGGFTNIVSEGCLQTITLNGGWNWWAPTIEMELGDIETNLGNRGILILSQNEGFARYENGWSGTLSEVGLGKMYKIQLTAGDPVFFEVEGGLSSGTTVTIEPGFNWIGYTGPAGLSIAEALGSFVPNDGDEIIDENGDSVYYDGENWEGNFTSLNPGKGYLYHSVANETKMITF